VTNNLNIKKIVKSYTNFIKKMFSLNLIFHNFDLGHIWTKLYVFHIPKNHLFKQKHTKNGEWKLLEKVQKSMK